ncbi:hypothetical protein PMAYCL1PPCAC_21550, partial [Pristionchus mayeri]
GSYCIYNLNSHDAKGTDVSVWVIKRSKALEFNYEIYDAVNMKRPADAPKEMVTIMSAQQFRVLAQPGEDNSYTARLAGFDNAVEGNPDLCGYAYRTPSVYNTF